MNSLDSIREKKILRDRFIEVNIVPKKDIVQIAFMDSGTGIKAKNRGKIFDPFFTTKAPGRGEGLGLFIIWNLLKMHGGRIFLSQEYKKGTKLILQIPKKTQYNREA